MPDHKTLAAIHAASNELGLSRDAYEDVLSSVAPGKTSSKLLTDTEVRALFDRFEELGWKSKKPKPQSPMANRFDNLANREGMATPKQLRLIEYKWKSNPRVQIKTGEALNKFIKNRFGLDGFRFIERQKVQAIIRAIDCLSIKTH